MMKFGKLTSRDAGRMTFMNLVRSSLLAQYVVVRASDRCGTNIC